MEERLLAAVERILNLGLILGEALGRGRTFLVHISAMGKQPMLLESSSYLLQ
ncbi:MAG: hypothetical protein IPI78_18065 [Chitinophagaceae bacterium]|nr:hypothetical protein [Chitinophagaceae bacterium]